MKKIPDGWEVVRLGEIGEIITGTTPSTNIKKFWGEGFPFVTPTDFLNSKYVFKTERTVTKFGVERGRRIPKDSVMVVCIASIGKVAMSFMECITNQQINTIICNKDIEPHYIYYVMIFSNKRLKQWAGITTSPIIKKSLFEKFPILLPPLPEQEKIAEILSTVDEAIEKVGQKIEKTERLKKGLMQKLLTEGIGHKEFKDTEIGKIPKAWEMVRYTDVADYINGYPFKPSDWQKKGFPIIRIQNLTGEKDFNYYNGQTEDWFCVKKGDLLFSWSATIDLFIWDGSDAVLNQHIFKVVPKQNIDKVFLYYAMKQYLANIVRKIHGSTMKHFKKEQLTKNYLPLPPIKEQEKIAEILSTVDRKLELEKRRKEKLERIKKGLMEELLTGKKRVKVE